MNDKNLFELYKVETIWISYYDSKSYGLYNLSQFSVLSVQCLNSSLETFSYEKIFVEKEAIAFLENIGRLVERSCISKGYMFFKNSSHKIHDRST